MSADPQSRVERALSEILAAEEDEVLPDPHAAFPGLEHADPSWIGEMSEIGALRAIAACEAAIARTQAVQLRALARLGKLRGDSRSAAAEVALAVSSTESRARAQLDLAETLTTRLPHTLAAMESGRIDAYKAGKVADATALLDDATARQADEVLADRVPGKNPVGIRQAAGRVAARLDPDGADRRAAARRHYRKVELIPRGEGMATLSADLPSEVATAIYTRLDRAARKLRVPDEVRTLDQLRTDVFAEVCLGASADSGSGGDVIGEGSSDAAPTARGQVRAEVFLHISAATLVGASDDRRRCRGRGRFRLRSPGRSLTSRAQPGGASSPIRSTGRFSMLAAGGTVHLRLWMSWFGFETGLVDIPVVTGPAFTATSIITRNGPARAAVPARRIWSDSAAAITA